MSGTKECKQCNGYGGYWHENAKNVWVICTKCGGRGRLDE